jgi:hypothetical protein
VRYAKKRELDFLYTLDVVERDAAKATGFEDDVNLRAVCG